MGFCWRWPALLPAARLSASPGCLQAWCVPEPAGAACPSPAGPGSGPARAQPAARLLSERRAGCVNLAPRSFPHSRQPMSGSAPPRSQPRPRPPPRQPAVTRLLRAHRPARHKGELRHPLRPPLPPPEPGGKVAARAAPREAASPGCPGRGTPGLGGIAGFTCRPSVAGAGCGAELSVGGAGNLKGKLARGTDSGAPEVGEPRPTRLLPPPPSPVAARAWGLCTASEGSASRDAHLRKTCDTVDVQHQTLGGRGVGRPGHEAGWRHSTMK